jgi:NhaA family Na+:H+ antiporter
VVCGLVVGKLVGISATTFAALQLRLGVLPEGMERRHVLGVAALGGIGFTVAIFIAGLAYSDQALIDDAKVGIFVGSIVSGLLGAVLLLTLGRRRASPG